MIMAAQFESLLHPFLVMLTLPMGAAGAFVSLLLGGQTLNVMSIIGMVVLVGLVVDDAIVEIDFINQLRRGGKGLRESVVEGCMTRLRADPDGLAATRSSASSPWPWASRAGIGAPASPWASSSSAGCCSRRFLTLILIPVVYEWVGAEARTGKVVVTREVEAAVKFFVDAPVATAMIFLALLVLGRLLVPQHAARARAQGGLSRRSTSRPSWPGVPPEIIQTKITAPLEEVLLDGQGRHGR